MISGYELFYQRNWVKCIVFFQLLEGFSVSRVDGRPLSFANSIVSNLVALNPSYVNPNPPQNLLLSETTVPCTWTNFN
jgi:hypothetical protein